MAILDEPTPGEMFRALGSKVDMLTASLSRIEGAVSLYVTQEQRAADLALAAERERQQNERIAELKADQAARSRWLLSAVLGPTLVALLVWLLTKGQI